MQLTIVLIGIYMYMYMITPACTFILSTRFLYNTDTLPCIVLCCICDLSPSHLSSLGSSVGRVLCSLNRASWVQTEHRGFESHLWQLIFLWVLLLFVGCYVVLCCFVCCLLSSSCTCTCTCRYNVYIQYTKTVCDPRECTCMYVYMHSCKMLL